MKFRLARLLVLAVAMFALATPSSAQVFTGRIDVTVADSTGAVLPGVTVELSGPENRTAVTDTSGEAHFLNLAPGMYTVSAKLQGFGDYANRNVPVVVGGIVPLKATMGVAGLATAVEVTAETPTIDPKKTATSTNVTYEELQNVPSSRDPWVVLQTIPGVIVDRVNVGGAESGQQSNYQAKGASSGDNSWNIDGVPITDMAALGSSPTYYDFDMFQEMQATTGGSDLTNATPGVALNMVLKSGSNTPRGSARFYFENEDLQANNLPDELKATLGGKSGKGNRIKEYSDYGGELGGPILRNRLWAWGSYGKTDITVLTLSNTSDQTILDNRSFKGTGQVTRDIRASYTYFRGDKLKYGRGASPTRPPETTWNQSGPTALHKGEGNFVVNDSLFLTGRYSYVDGGFNLTPQGGLGTNWYIDDTGTWRGSAYDYLTVRPQTNAAGEGNFFRGRHEVKFGFGWRTVDVDSTTTVPGNGIISYHDGYPNMVAEVTAWNHSASTNAKYANAYIGDTISFDRLTLNVGVRWDRSRASVNGFSQKGNPVLASLLPDVSGTAVDDVLDLSAVTPRIGISYALDDSRKTLLRASYGSFVSQLGATAGGFLSTVQYRGVYYYNVTDTNGNGYVDAAELAGRSPDNWYGFDITNPGQVSSPIHKVGDYKTPRTHELQFGADRELMANFGISGTVTWRQFTNFNWRNNGIVGTDYQQIATLEGSQAPIGSYSTPIFGPTRLPANRAATEFRSRDGYSQRYLGFEAAATKRLSNRWMARFGFSTNDHREYFETAAAMTDPTPGPSSPNKDGGTVIRLSGGSGKSGIYQVLPKYQFIATGMYQAPWGINLAANMVTRQGFSTPYFRNLVPTADPLSPRKTVLLVDDVAEHRLPAVTSLDARLGKELAVSRLRFNVDLDVFNLLNSNVVLGRQYNLRLGTADSVLEIMNPRVLRVGVRVNF